MILFLLRKIGFFFSLYVFASLAIFAVINAIPGDPIELRFGKFVDSERVTIERERLGLDQAWPARYLMFQKRFLTGDWGESLSSGRKTVADFKDFMPATLELSLCALAFGVFLGLAISLLSVSSRGRIVSRIGEAVASLGIVVPIFWIGIVLLLVGSYWLGLFPMDGRFDLSVATTEGPSGMRLVDSLVHGEWNALFVAMHHLFLPTLCLGLYPAASVASVANARLREPELVAMLVALRARGYSRARILWRHMLRVSAAPTVTVVGTSFGVLLGGAFLTETVFTWPGIGRYLVTAILDRDIFVVQNMLTFIVLLAIAVALVSDLLVWKLDPRNRESEEAR